MGLDTRERLELLHRISNIVSSNRTLEEILEDLIQLTVTVTHGDACLVYFVDHSTSEIVLCASRLSHTFELGKIRLKMGEGIAGWVAQHRSVVALAAKAASDSRFKSFQALPEDAYEALLSVPLISGGELIGVINIHHREKHAHTPDEIAVARFIGEQMGSAIAKSDLSERSLRASHRIEALAGLVRTISEENHLNQILQAISETVATVLSSPVCFIRLADQTRPELVASPWRRSAPGYLRKIPLKNDDSVGRIVPERGPVIVANMAEERNQYPELARIPGLISQLSIPMITRKRIIGTMNIYTRGPRQFSVEELGFVNVVASQAAIAIENAQLIAEALEIERKLMDRNLIERAKGILQQKLALTEEQSYLLLCNRSRSLRRPMRKMAEAIILAHEMARKKDL